MQGKSLIRKEDYEEPNCPLIDPATGQPQSCGNKSIPVMRVLEKLDALCGQEEYAAAERHLLYWFAEAEALGDRRGCFCVANELMGYYRKQGRKEEAISWAQKALALMEELDYGEAPGGATCYVNCGTVYDAFAMPEEAIGFFEKAKSVYENAPHREWNKLGGLYNNMALALADLGRFDEAEAYYAEALEAMAHVENGELEQAITWLNLADAAVLKNGQDASQEEISDYLKKAKALLDTPSIPRNGYYAFVLEKCAPAFYCHGDAAYGETIDARAKEIYQKNRNGAQES